MKKEGLEESLKKISKLKKELQREVSVRNELVISALRKALKSGNAMYSIEDGKSSIEVAVIRANVRFVERAIRSNGEVFVPSCPRGPGDIFCWRYEVGGPCHCVHGLID